MAAVPAPLGKMVDSVRGFSLAQRTIMIIGIAILVMGGIAFATLFKPTENDTPVLRACPGRRLWDR